MAEIEQTEARRRSSDDLLEIPAIGSFTVFGVTKRPVRLIGNTGLGEAETTALAIPLGGEYHLFLRTPASNLVKTNGVIALKLGFIRSPSGEILSPADLLAQRVATPQLIDCEEVEGDAVIGCFHLQEPRFSLFRTLLGVPDLYYWAADGEILCSDNLKALIALLPTPQLDPKVLPMHFLYRFVGGHKTYVENVHRLPAGSTLTWHAGRLELEYAKDIRDSLRQDRFSQMSDEAATFLFQRYAEVVGHYLREAAPSGKGFGSLLSGGVDSSLMQLLIDEHLAPGVERRSFSYAVDTPAFLPEVEYAVQVTQRLGTRHTFVPIAPEEYPALLIDAIRILGQPVAPESVPCVLPVARYLSQQGEDIAYLFCGAAADALHGVSKAEILWHLQRWVALPAAGLGLKLFEPLMRAVDPHKAFLMRTAVSFLPYVNDVTSPRFPCNEYGVYTDFELVRRSFDADAIRSAFACRQEEEARYLNSPSLIEKVQTLSLLSIVHPIASLWHQLFLAYGIALIHPYLDEKIVKTTYAFDPGIRFYHKGRIKPILKRLLEQRSLAEIASLPKRGSGFHLDLMQWMREGVLQDMVHAIERPPFLDKADFERKLEEPDWFTWSMLTLDLFHKNVLQA